MGASWALTRCWSRARVAVSKCGEGLVEDDGGGGFVDFAGLDADEAVFEVVDASDAVRSGEEV